MTQPFGEPCFGKVFGKGMTPVHRVQGGGLAFSQSGVAQGVEPALSIEG
jgi:hypothetical protein